jgi:methionyl-tRNA synthetase
VGQFQRLIERVDPKKVEAMLSASAASLEAQEPAARQVTIEALAPQITYDEFSKVDLRVATVLHAEAVEGADKLLRLRVDIGSEQRTIFAGIRQSYRPEDLIGKQVIVVANLQPRKMRFGVSEGMLLAAGPDSADVVVAEFGQRRQPGERVR